MNELRYAELTDIETRDENLQISGYAIVFDEPSQVLGGQDGFREVISQRALDGVDLTDTHLYYQHKSDSILANTKSDTMKLEVTNKGLYFRANLADTTLGRDTYSLIKRGDLSAMSFSFTVTKDTWNTTVSPEVRTVHQIGKLDEVSIVSRPAYTQSSVNARSAEFLQECRECRTDFNKEIEVGNTLAEEARTILSSVSSKNSEDPDVEEACKKKRAMDETPHGDPYTQKDKEMVENISKMDLSDDEKTSIDKVLDHITEELEEGI